MKINAIYFIKNYILASGRKRPGLGVNGGSWESGFARGVRFKQFYIGPEEVEKEFAIMKDTFWQMLPRPFGSQIFPRF